MKDQDETGQFVTYDMVGDIPQHHINENYTFEDLQKEAPLSLEECAKTLRADLSDVIKFIAEEMALIQAQQGDTQGSLTQARLLVVRSEEQDYETEGGQKFYIKIEDAQKETEENALLEELSEIQNRFYDKLVHAMSFSCKALKVGLGKKLKSDFGYKEIVQLKIDMIAQATLWVIGAAEAFRQRLCQQAVTDLFFHQKITTVEQAENMLKMLQNNKDILSELSLEEILDIQIETEKVVYPFARV